MSTTPPSGKWSAAQRQLQVERALASGPKTLKQLSEAIGLSQRNTRVHARAVATEVKLLPSKGRGQRERLYALVSRGTCLDNEASQ